METQMTTNKWKCFALCSGLLMLAACTQSGVSSLKTESVRAPAALQDEVPRLVYITYDKQGKAHQEEISEARWNGQSGGFSEGGREDYLLKMYYSNTRNTSLKGLRHVSCFYGDAQSVAKNFFAEDGSAGLVRNLAAGRAEVKPSRDGRKLGLRLDHAGKGILTFRLSHCESGKSSIANSLISSWVAGTEKNKTTKNPVRKVASVDPAEAFTVLDDTKFDDKKLPRFALRADYPKGNVVKDRFPWTGLDLRDKKQALKFILMVQLYFYENMANQNPQNPDFNFIAQKNKDRYWCHMPWLHVTENGREAIHGLTKERDLVSSPRIPAYKNTTPGSNWGVAYFNEPACKNIGNVFGTAQSPLKEPDFSKSVFDDGTVIVKMLFTTADFPEIKNAYQWKGTVSGPGETNRRVQPLRHIQMDIAVKDSSLKGTLDAIDHWVMAGFYYDENFDFDKEYSQVLGIKNPLMGLPNIPKELFKMRPIGVQTGFDGPDSGDTVIFPGAYANGSGGRLNGPADNPKTSCLGCHGAAGTGASMVPGFLSLRMFEPYKEKTGLDFNQQFALAQENYDTEMGKK